MRAATTRECPEFVSLFGICGAHGVARPTIQPKLHTGTIKMRPFRGAESLRSRKSGLRLFGYAAQEAGYDPTGRLLYLWIIGLLGNLNESGLC